MYTFTISFRKSSLVLLLYLVQISCSKKTDIPVPTINTDTITETQPATIVAFASSVTPNIGGYYAAMPPHYEQTSKQYPLLFFFHGNGQMGNGQSELPYLLTDGLGKLLKEKKFPPSFTIGQSKHSFIIILPQYSQRPSTDEVLAFIEDTRKKYRVDPARIYLAGLSMGGNIITDAASYAPGLFAAVTSMSGIDFNSTDSTKCEKIAQGSVPLWVFHNVDDPMISGYYSTSFINIINYFNPAIIPKLTIFPYYGHDSWTMALDTAYKEENKNVYEWMLTYTR
ncbi:MAG TPA: PHB depolymerase family esterase [Flavitalea sp.]|nr:PHB depolymerase family esterase [Flavitalea sp.]